VAPTAYRRGVRTSHAVRVAHSDPVRTTAPVLSLLLGGRKRSFRPFGCRLKCCAKTASQPLAPTWLDRRSRSEAFLARGSFARVTSARFAFVSWQCQCNSRLKRGMAEDFRESGRRHRAASRCTRTSTPRPSSGTTRDAERLGARGGVGLCNPGHRGAGPRLFAVRANFVSHRALIPELSRALTVFLTQPSAL
jgi:hypothetical protein